MQGNPNARSYIRIMAGGYLIYMAVQMIRELLGNTSEPPDNPALVWTFAILFIIAGAAIILLDARNILAAKKEAEAQEAEKTQQTECDTIEDTKEQEITQSETEEETDET